MFRTNPMQQQKTHKTQHEAAAAEQQQLNE